MLRELRDLSAVAIIVYASAIRPKLPSYIISLFDSSMFRILIIALISYLATNNSLQFSILLAIGFVVVIGLIKEQLLYEGFTEGMEEAQAKSKPAPKSEDVPSAPTPKVTDEELQELEALESLNA